MHFTSPVKKYKMNTSINFKRNSLKKHVVISSMFPFKQRHFCPGLCSLRIQLCPKKGITWDYP